MGYIVQITAPVSAAKVTLPASVPSTAKVTAILKQTDATDCPVIGSYSGAGGIWNLTCTDGLTVPDSANAVFSVEMASMPVGEKGDKGDKGDKGLKGDKGDIGPQGPQGVQGIQGVKGDTGPKGDAGPAGVSAPLLPVRGVRAQNMALREFPQGQETVMKWTGIFESISENDLGNPPIYLDDATSTRFKAIEAGTFMFNTQICVCIPSYFGQSNALAPRGAVALVMRVRDAYGYVIKAQNCGHFQVTNKDMFGFLYFNRPVYLKAGQTVEFVVCNFTNGRAWATDNEYDHSCSVYLLGK